MKVIGFSKRTVNIVLLSSIVFFIILTLGIEVHSLMIHRLDVTTFNWWLGHFGEPQMTFHQGLLTGYFTFFAQYFDVITIVLLTIIAASVLAWRKYYALSLWLMSVVASGGLIGIIFNDHIHRNRPYDHLIADTGYSFPSGHTLASSLFFIVIIFILLPHTRHEYIKLRYFICTLSVMTWISILLSRLYFHAHFITDIFGGIALSIIWVMMFVRLYPLVFEPICNRVFKHNQTFHMVA